MPGNLASRSNKIADFFRGSASLFSARLREERAQRTLLARLHDRDTEVRAKLDLAGHAAAGHVRHLEAHREYAGAASRALSDTQDDLQKLKQLHAGLTSPLRRSGE